MVAYIPNPYDPEGDAARLAEEEQKEREYQQQAQEDLETQQGDRGPETVNPLAIANQNLQQGISSLVGAIGGQGLQQQYEANQAKTQQIQQESDQALEEQAPGGVVGFLDETARVALDTAVGTVESTLDTLDLAGDILKTGALTLTGQKVKATENPWSDRYTAAAYNFGLAKPRTEIGKFASKIGQMVVLTRTVAKLAPKALVQLGTKGVGIKGAIASGIVPGAVADFMLTDPGDGNFSEMINNLLPEDHFLRDSFVTALATDETDDIFTRKVKGTLEGGVFGAVADGLGWMLVGRKAAQKALKAGKSEPEALAEGLKAGEEARKQVDAEHAKNLSKEADRWEDIHQDELEQLLKTQQQLGAKEESLKAAGIPDTDPEYRAVKELQEDVQQALNETDEAIAKGYYPDDARTNLPQDAAANVKEGDINKAIAEQQEAKTVGEPFSDAPAPRTKNPYASDYIADPRGGAEHLLTDAQYKIQKFANDEEALIRDLTKKADLQEFARRLKVPVDVAVREAAQELEDFRAAIDGGITNESLYDLMKQAQLVDPDSVSGTILSEKGILVTKALIRDTSMQINEIARNAAELRGSGELVGNTLDRIVDRMSMLLKLHKATAYKSGYNLNMFKQAIGLGADEAAAAAKEAKEFTRGDIDQWAVRIKRLMRSEAPEAQEELDSLIRAMVLAGGDPLKTVSFGNAVRSLGAKQAMNQIYQSMLSGPITHLRNLFGNSYSLFERPFSTYLRGKFKGDKVLQASASAGMHSMYMGLSDAWKVFKTTMKTGVSSNFNAKFAVEDFEARAILEQLHTAARTDGEKRAAQWLQTHYDFLHNPWLSWPSTALQAGDDFFKSLAARYRMGSQAMYDAMTKSTNPANVDYMFNQYMKSYSKGIDPVSGRILDKDLLNYAERITFQQDPGKFMNTIANAIENSPGGVGRLFMPFVRTPANLMSYGLEHVPLIHKVIKGMGDTLEAAEKAGDHLLVAEIKGRQATGTLLVSSMVGLALATDVTGNYPADPNERKAWIAEGRPPMSIKIGNKWVSYASFEPVNSMLSIVADGMRLAKAGGADAAGQIFKQLGYSIAAGYTDKSFLAGLSEIGQILDPKNVTNPDPGRFLLNTANNLVPYAGVRRAFARSLDPYLKETRGDLDRMLTTAMPGFGTDVPSVTSWITGKKLLSIGGGIYNAFSPIRIQDVNDDFVAKTLSDIGYPSNDILKNGKGVKLAPQHRERLAQLLYKMGLPKQLEAMFKNKSWQDLAKAYEGRPITLDMLAGGSEDTPEHVRMIQAKVNKAKKKALEILLAEDPTFRELVLEEKVKRSKLRRGDTTAIDSELIKQLADY